MEFKITENDQLAHDYFKKTRFKLMLILALAIVCFISIPISVTISGLDISMLGTYEAIYDHIMGNVTNYVNDYIIWDMNLPRALFAIITGAGLAVAMPAVFTYTMQHDVMRFAKIAVRVWGCPMDFEHPERTAKAGIEALRSFLISIGMPKNFAGIGAREEDIDYLAHTCCWGSEHADGKKHGFMELNEEDIKAIYRLML